MSITLGTLKSSDPDALFTTREVAAALRVSMRTLEQWRSVGEGPCVTKVGPKKVAYRAGAVLNFACA